MNKTEIEFSEQFKHLDSKYPDFIRELGLLTWKLINNAETDDITLLSDIVAKSFHYAIAYIATERAQAAEHKGTDA
jgi:hypothetical protein